MTADGPSLARKTTAKDMERDCRMQFVFGSAADDLKPQGAVEAAHEIVTNARVLAPPVVSKKGVVVAQFGSEFEMTAAWVTCQQG